MVISSQGGTSPERCGVEDGKKHSVEKPGKLRRTTKMGERRGWSVLDSRRKEKETDSLQPGVSAPTCLVEFVLGWIAGKRLMFKSKTMQGTRIQ